MAKEYVLVTGSIGVGKTTVLRSPRFQNVRHAIFEESAESYLSDFYRYPKRFAFHNELAYAVQFLGQCLSIARCEDIAVQERSIYDTVGVFSVLWRDSGGISHGEFDLLERLQRIATDLAKPTWVFLLRLPTRIAMDRIRERARPGEDLITFNYLERLDRRYDEWFAELRDCNKLAIETEGRHPDAIAHQITSCLAKPR